MSTDASHALHSLRAVHPFHPLHPTPRHIRYARHARQVPELDFSLQPLRPLRPPHSPHPPIPQVPKLDFSQIALLYGARQQVLRAAALKSLNLRALSARLPGVERPLSRELTPINPPALTDRGTGAGSKPSALSAPGKLNGAASAPPAPPPKLPPTWNALCKAREDCVEQLENLALRLQSYGQSVSSQHSDNIRQVTRVTHVTHVTASRSRRSTRTTSGRRYTLHDATRS